jgi:penicillin-binding protein 2
VDSFAGRKNIIRFIIGLIGLIFIIRLFILQVVDSTYKLTASNNVLRYETQFPARGLIFDRNGNLMVYNEAAYDIMVNPKQVLPFDTAEFCSILEIDKNYIDENILKARQYSLYKPSIFLKQVSSLAYAQLQEKLYKFPGFFVQPRTIRKYNSNNAAHVLGYVGEVNDKMIEANSYYNLGDYIGISGIEQSYEEYLRGKKGVSILLVDVHNRIKGPYNNGRFDEKAVVGSNVISTIDFELQKYGEKLMENLTGSVVAIEPSTGEIIALISTPNYNPELLVGRIRTKNYNILMMDSLKPLFNRALMAQYPPGSTFKVINALIGQQEKVLFPYTSYGCQGGYVVGRFRLGCHIHNSPLNLVQSIQNSCNTYYCHVFRNILDNSKYPSVRDAYEIWRNHVMSFGFGKPLNSDFGNELAGLIPKKEMYDRIHKTQNWKSLNVISLAIGQGEMGTTPLQMANMTAAIANRGYYYIPHIVKEVEGDFSLDKRFYEKQFTSIDSTYFEPVVRGMELAVNGDFSGGSTAWRAQIPNIIVCGKTGTAQNPHGEDHSIFIAFAPKDDPKIAIAVYIENGGFGGTWAAPLARLMIEKYLTDSISQPYYEDYILNAHLTIKNATKSKHLE